MAREEGVPTLISLHDVALACAFADRIVGLAGGVTVFTGTPATLDDRALDTIYDPRRRLATARRDSDGSPVATAGVAHDAHD